MVRQQPPCYPGGMRSIVALLLVAACNGVLGIALAQDSTTTTTTTTTSTTHTRPPEQVACGVDFQCNLRACRKLCGATASGLNASYCRRMCTRLLTNCLHANECDFSYPYCLTGLQNGECSGDSPATTYGCAVLQIANRTNEVLSNVSVNGQPAGLDIAPRTTLRVLTPQSPTGVTVTAAGTVSVDQAGAPCVWTFTRTTCLDEIEKQRVVFRRGHSSCGR